MIRSRPEDPLTRQDALDSVIEPVWFHLVPLGDRGGSRPDDLCRSEHRIQIARSTSCVVSQCDCCASEEDVGAGAATVEFVGEFLEQRTDPGLA